MRPKGTKEALESRRREAVALYQRGYTTREVAEVIGCAPASVSRWNQCYESEGAAGLDPKPQGGSMSRMSPAQMLQLSGFITSGARAYGFHNELWTLSRIRSLIRNEFGIEYCLSSIHGIWGALGFSHQKPERRAREQDPNAVVHFRRYQWPAIKKNRGRPEGISFS